MLGSIAKSLRREKFKLVTSFIKLTGIGRYSDLERIKNAHAGKRCFIVGNGPSLTIEDLEKLHTNNEICFASNRIDRIYEKTNWRPNYICVMDKGSMSYAKNIEPDEYCRQILDEQLTYCFFEDGMKSLINGTGIKDDRILYFRNEFRNGKDTKLCFSDDITVRVEDFATVTSTCIQFAVYMGFTEIILLGQDMTFSYYIDLDGKIVNENVKDYFDNENRPVKLQGLTNYKGMITGFETVKKYTDAHGVKVYNATPGGRLHVFERINLSDI